MWYNFVERGYFGLLSQHILVGWPCSAGGASIFFHSSPQQIPINSAAGPSQKVVRINFIRSKCFKLTCSSWLADSISAKLTDSQRGSKQDLPTTLPLSKVYFFFKNVFFQKCILPKIQRGSKSFLLAIFQILDCPVLRNTSPPFSSIKYFWILLFARKTLLGSGQ